MGCKVAMKIISIMVVMAVGIDIVTGALKYTRRLDFTTGKRVDRGDNS